MAKCAIRTRVVALPRPLISQNTIIWAVRDSTWAYCEASFDYSIPASVSVFLVPEHTIRISITYLRSSVSVRCVSPDLTLYRLISVWASVSSSAPSLPCSKQSHGRTQPRSCSALRLPLSRRVGSVSRCVRYGTSTIVATHYTGTNDIYCFQGIVVPSHTIYGRGKRT